MKRFVLLVCAVVFSFGAYAVDADALFKQYSNVEGVTYVTLSKKAFNLMKPFLGLDKEMKHLFNALNLRQMDMFQIGSESAVDKSRVLSELSSLGADPTYVKVQGASDDGDEENSAFFYSVDGDRIVDLVIYANKDGNLVAMKVSCDAELSRILNILDEMNPGKNSE